MRGTASPQPARLRHPRCGFAPAECSALSDALARIHARALELAGPMPELEPRFRCRSASRFHKELVGEWRERVDALWSETMGKGRFRPLILMGGYRLCLAPSAARDFHLRFFGSEPGCLPAKWRSEPAPISIISAIGRGEEWDVHDPEPIEAPDRSLRPRPAAARTGRRRPPASKPVIYRAALRAYLDADSRYGMGAGR